MTASDRRTLPRLPPRPADAHKGIFGTALIVGGSRGMTGAVALAGMAALRGGAGLVRLAVADCCLDVVAGLGALIHDRPAAGRPAGPHRRGRLPADREVSRVGHRGCLGARPGAVAGLGRAGACASIARSPGRWWWTPTP